jgi:hypothetical protein
LDERTAKAFDFAKDVTVQLITLATGIIGIEVTLLKDVIETVSHGGRWFLFVSWIALLLSVIFGIMTILALTGTLQPKDESVPLTIWGRNITALSVCQIILFLMGLVLTIAFGASGIWSLHVNP